MRLRFLIPATLIVVFVLTTFLAYAADKYAEKDYDTVVGDGEVYDQELAQDDNDVTGNAGFHNHIEDMGAKKKPVVDSDRAETWEENQKSEE